MTDTMSAAPMTTVEALDAAFAGEACELVRRDGRSLRLPTRRWTGPASPTDIALFVDRCSGPTLDVGCGPGRLTEALWDRGVDVLGVDISHEAVRQTRARGAMALCHDIFAPLPGTGLWTHVLLADGNIGLGGRPERLLRRVAEVLSPRGTVLVELAATGTVSVLEGVRLRVGERSSGRFDWATVGVDAIAGVADRAGLGVVTRVEMAGRHVATLQHAAEASRSAWTPGGAP